MEHTDEELRQIFKMTTVIAAVGLSSKQERPSYGVCAYLQAQGFRVIPVNPRESQVLGEIAYPDLGSVPEKIDLVLIFREPAAVPEVVEEAIAVGAKVVWMQDGAGNVGVAERAEGAGLIVVVNDCMLRQHRRLMLEAGQV